LDIEAIPGGETVGDGEGINSIIYKNMKGGAM
jgi:hypothetical protein